MRLVFPPVRPRDLTGVRTGDDGDRDAGNGAAMATGTCPPPSPSSPAGVHSNGDVHHSSFVFVHPVYLDEITKKLNSEDPSTRPLRRALGFMDILNKVDNLLS